MPAQLHVERFATRGISRPAQLFPCQQHEESRNQSRICLGSGILDMVLSPIVATLQPGSRATALNWLHSFYGIGTVVTVLVGTLAFRLEVGWRTISLTLITVPLLVALGFVKVDLPPLIS